MVEQRVVGTTSELVIADRRCRRDSTSAVRRRLSVKYDGACKRNVPANVMLFCL